MVADKARIGPSCILVIKQVSNNFVTGFWYNLRQFRHEAEFFRNQRLKPAGGVRIILMFLFGELCLDVAAGCR